MLGLIFQISILPIVSKLIFIQHITCFQHRRRSLDRIVFPWKSISRCLLDIILEIRPVWVEACTKYCFISFFSVHFLCIHTDLLKYFLLNSFREYLELAHRCVSSRRDLSITSYQACVLNSVKHFSLLK